jgi:short-subunit dehydrogenase
VGAAGRFDRQPLDRQLAMLRVNITALTELTALVLPGMVRHRAGRILNVASVAAFLPGPMMAVYYASKSFVLSLSLALREELRGTGVTVTALCPGPTPTRFQATAGLAEAGGSRLLRTGAQPVALAGYRGLMRGAGVVVPGAANRLVALGCRFIPRTVAARLAGWNNRWRAPEARRQTG